MTDNTKKEESKIDNISFEKGLEELETIVRKLESGNDELEDSIKLYENGVKLLKACEKRLNDAKLKVELITKNENGEYGTAEFKE